MTILQTNWKIRHIPTGLYCKGGTMPHPRWANKDWNIRHFFTKTGKTWTKRCYVERHINDNQEFYDIFSGELELIQVQMIEGSVEDMGDVLAPLKEREAERLRKREVRNKEARIARLERRKKEAERELAKLKGEQ